MKKYLPLFFLLIYASIQAQVPIELYRQFNGRYNHTALGNTLNIHDNSIDAYVGFCDVLDASSATLTLDPDQVIVGAFLYWSGPVNTQEVPGLQIDDNVSLNGISIDSEETFLYTLGPNHQYFACFTDVTALVQGIGVGVYDFTDLDLSFILTSPYHCSSVGGNQTNYGGWAISVVYEQASLPYNQVSIFNGLDGVSRDNNYIGILLDNLNVIDDDGAKIGFLAWEGDEDLAIGESLFINGNLISNPPLNPPNNAFNGTNSYTNSSELHNMDLDFYEIEDNISAGDDSALIELRSLADLVMVNYVVTVLNSQLPDATVQIDDILLACDNETLQIDYTIFNINSTEILPAGTPISFYADGVLIASAYTEDDIAIGDNELGTIIITLPSSIPITFNLIVVADDDGTGTGTVQETDETNNSTSLQVDLLLAPVLTALPNIEECDLGANTAFFDVTSNEGLLDIGTDIIKYYITYDDAVNQENELIDPSNYQNITDPQQIYIRVDNMDCYQITSFNLTTTNCPPWVPSGFSPNNDGTNDEFEILGLLTIFDEFELKIYNRLGTLVYVGGDELGFWDGKSNKGINNRGSLLPVGTYYYVLHLNDPNFSKPLLGWVYMNY